MAINPSLLIAAPMLQDVLIDNVTGLPMANGTVTMYQDNSRTTLKNWYYQTGQPGAYNYLPLDNPLTLSASGTITDPNGNDTIPFYYPYSETDNITRQPYYVVVVDQNDQSEITRQNFPFVAPSNTNVTGVPTNKNLIVNSVFWRNAGTTINLTTPSQTIPITTAAGTNNYLYQTLAPSQHEGFSMPDIIFLKNIAGSTDTISFNVIPQINGQDQVFTNDITPEYLLNFQCTAAIPGETIKCVQIPISLHVKSLAGVACSIVIEAQNVNSTANNNLAISVFQFLGTGATSTFPTAIQTLTLNSTWTKYIVTFTFPASTANIGTGGDDALYLQIGLPLSEICNVNFAKPSIYLSTTVPTNDTETYDQVNAITSSPRTGDVRTTLNSFYPFGWIPLNGGTIGNASSNATARANTDAWPLFNLIWNAFNAYSTGSSSSGTNPLSQMFTSTGTPVGYGPNVSSPTTAIQDWNANKKLALTQTMGQVLLGTVPASALLSTNTNTFTATNNGGNIQINPTSTMNLFSGMPIVFSNTGGALPGGLSANTIYFVSHFNSSGSTFGVATSFSNALNGVVIAFSSAGTGTNTVTADITGSFTGEYAHILLSSELPNPITTSAASFSATGSGTVVIESSATPGSGTIANSGGNQPHNTIQPGIFMNMFIKM